MLVRYDDVMPLAQEMIANMDPLLFDSEVTTFVDPAIASGSYLKAVEERLHTHGHSKINISKRLFGFCSSRIKQNNIKKKFGFEPIWLDGNFMETNMKFDVVIGNPPYQKEGAAKRWVLWHEFIKKSIELSDSVAFVVPASLVGPGDMFNSIKSSIKILNLDVKKHFNVGSTFCYFVYDKSFFGKTQVITEQDMFELDLNEIEFLPPTVTQKTLDMMKLLKGDRVWKRGEYHTSDTEWKSNEGMEVIHTVAQTLNTERLHPNTSKIRVGVTLSGYPKFVSVKDKGFSQACFWTEFDNIKEADEFAEYCNSPSIQEVLKTYKWSGWNSKEVITKL